MYVYYAHTFGSGTFDSGGGEPTETQPVPTRLLILTYLPDSRFQRRNGCRFCVDGKPSNHQVARAGRFDADVQQRRRRRRLRLASSSSSSSARQATVGQQKLRVRQVADQQSADHLHHQRCVVGVVVDVGAALLLLLLL